MTSQASQNNNKLFPFYKRKLAVDDPTTYVQFADKFAIWLSDERAYYPEARPNIVQLLETAQGTLRRAVGATDVTIPFHVSTCLDHPMTPSYIRLIEVVRDHSSLFVESQYQDGVRALTQSISGSHSREPSQMRASHSRSPAAPIVNSSKTAVQQAPLQITRSDHVPPVHDQKNTMQPSSSSLASALQMDPHPPLSMPPTATILNVPVAIQESTSLPAPNLPTMVVQEIPPIPPDTLLSNQNANQAAPTPPVSLKPEGSHPISVTSSASNAPQIQAPSSSKPISTKAKLKKKKKAAIDQNLNLVHLDTQWFQSKEKPQESTIDAFSPTTSAVRIKEGKPPSEPLQPTAATAGPETIKQAQSPSQDRERHVSEPTPSATPGPPEGFPSMSQVILQIDDNAASAKDNTPAALPFQQQHHENTVDSASDSKLNDTGSTLASGLLTTSDARVMKTNNDATPLGDDVVSHLDGNQTIELEGLPAERFSLQTDASTGDFATTPAPPDSSQISEGRNVTLSEQATTLSNIREVGSPPLKDVKGELPQHQEHEKKEEAQDTVVAPETPHSSSPSSKLPSDMTSPPAEQNLERVVLHPVSQSPVEVLLQEESAVQAIKDDPIIIDQPEFLVNSLTQADSRDVSVTTNAWQKGVPHVDTATSSAECATEHSAVVNASQRKQELEAPLGGSSPVKETETLGPDAKPMTETDDAIACNSQPGSVLNASLPMLSGTCSEETPASHPYDHPMEIDPPPRSLAAISRPSSSAITEQTTAGSSADRKRSRSPSASEASRTFAIRQRPNVTTPLTTGPSISSVDEAGSKSNPDTNTTSTSLMSVNGVTTFASTAANGKENDAVKDGHVSLPSSKPAGTEGLVTNGINGSDSTKLNFPSGLGPMLDKTFGPEMVAIAVQRGSVSGGTITIEFSIDEGQFALITRWNNRSKTTEDVKESLCLSLACYSSAELLALIKGMPQRSSVEQLVSSHRSSWPKTGGLSMNVKYNGERRSFPLSPPFGMTPDNLVDVSEFLDVGKNTIELSQRRDMSKYTFFLHAHFPTHAQLEQVAQRRHKAQDWKDWLHKASQPLYIPLPQFS